MKTSFGIINDNIYEISNWHELLNIKSEFKDIALSVNDIKDHMCEGTSISIFNSVSKINYVTFFVSYDDDNIVAVSNIITSTDIAVKILNSFGFRIKFVEDLTIEEATLTLEWD